MEAIVAGATANIRLLREDGTAIDDQIHRALNLRDGLLNRIANARTRLTNRRHEVGELREKCQHRRAQLQMARMSQQLHCDEVQEVSIAQ